MGGFLAELRRRHIFRIGGIYVVAAWGITQVLDVLSQIFALPDWIAQPALVVLAIGFPVVLIAAWVIIGEAKASRKSTAPQKATATDWTLIGGLAVVILLIGYQRAFMTDSANTPSAALASNSSAASIAGDIVEEVSDRLSNSIAVLPLENLSPDPDDAYFAAGVHDEIINKLSKLQNLTVIARGSVMRYAGTDLPIPQVAQELNVEMVMTGTVRYAGDQVRVTAELIDGMSNLPVWTTEDEGDLSDIFAIQSDIAMSIANSLQAQFSAAEQASVESVPTDSPDAYRFYLRALSLASSATYRGSASGGLREAIRLQLDQAIRLDPEFAMAYPWKAFIHAVSRNFDIVPEEDRPAFLAETDRLIVENANRAIALDPSVGLAHAALSQMYRMQGERGMAVAEAKEALRLNPNDLEAVTLAIGAAAIIDDVVADPVALMQNAAQRDPNNGLAHRFLADTLMQAGRFDEAAESYEKCLDVGVSAVCSGQLALIELRRGNEQESLNWVRYTDQVSNGGANIYAINAYLYGRLGRHEDAQKMSEGLDMVARQG